MLNFEKIKGTICLINGLLVGDATNASIQLEYLMATRLASSGCSIVFFRFFSYCRSYFVGGDASVGVVFVIQIGGRQQDLARTRFLVSFQWHQCVTLLLRS